MMSYSSHVFSHEQSVKKILSFEDIATELEQQSLSHTKLVDFIPDSSGITLVLSFTAF